jgi:hypothetical protein
MLVANEQQAIVPSIDFPCFVKGTPLTASLTHIEDSPMHLIYFVKFSDGYQSRFMTSTSQNKGSLIDIEGKSPYHKKKDQRYAQAIAPDLSALLFYSPNRDLHLIVMDLPDAVDVNVWVVQHFDNPTKYNVRYLNSYRFTRERTDHGWEAYTVGQIHSKKPSESLVRFITARIDAKLQCA